MSLDDSLQPDRNLVFSTSSEQRSQREGDVERFFFFFFTLLSGITSAFFLILASTPADVIQHVLSFNTGRIGSRIAGWFQILWVDTLLLRSSLLFLLCCIIGCSLLLLKFARREKPSLLSPLLQQLLAQRGLSSFLTLFFFSLGVVLFYDAPSLVVGFFAYDDFEFLYNNRTYSLSTLLLHPHGQITMPLFRLECFLLDTLFGIHPLGWNGVVLLLFLATLVVGNFFLLELNLTPLARMGFVLFFTAWAKWGVITTGYYCLSIYLQIACLSLLAAWGELRWLRIGNPRYYYVTFVALFFALSLHPSAFWASAAILILGLAADWAKNPTDTHVTRWRRHRPVFFGILLLSLFFTVIHGMGLMHIERMVSSSPNPFSWQTFFRQILFWISGGLLLSILAPLAEGYLNQFGLLYPLLYGISLGGGLLALFLFRTASPSSRRWALGLLSPIVAIAVVVVLGRWREDSISLWQTKYIAPAFLWLSCFLAWLWERIRIHFRTGMLQTQSPTSAWVYGGFLAASLWGLLFYLVIQGTMDKAGGMGPRDLYNGRAFHRLQAWKRREALRDLQKTFRPLLVPSDKEIVLPTLDGRYIQQKSPILAHYNLSHYAAFLFDPTAKVRLVRNPALSAWGGEKVAVVSSLRKAIDPLFLDLLEKHPALQSYYLASVEVPLRSDSQRGKVGRRQKNSPLLRVSDGTTRLVVKAGRWDPDQLFMLRFQGRFEALEPMPQTSSSNLFSPSSLKAPSPPAHAKVHILFSGSLRIPYPQPWFLLPTDMTIDLSIDLRQIYAYALSDEIEDLALLFSTPGRYVISDLTLE